MRVLCSICMRKNSKGLKNKNFKNLNNKPLLYYTINQALKSRIFSKIVVSTDSEKIMELSKKYNAEIFFKRPKKLSSSNISKIEVIKHLLKKSENHFNQKFDYIVDLDVTSPIRKPKNIREAFDKIIKNNLDILFSVTKSRKNPYFNMIQENTAKYFDIIKKNKLIYSRQKAPKCYDMNASIYIWKRQALLSNRSLFTKNNGIYLMPEESAFDIDSLLDFNIVEHIMKKYNYE